MSPRLLRTIKMARKLSKHKYFLICPTEFDLAPPHHDHDPNVDIEMTAGLDDDFDYDDMEDCRPSSAYTSDDSKTQLLSALEIDLPRWTWKNTVKFWMWQARANVTYAIESYRINKAFGPEFDY
ncbi:hypothetical protein CLAIMM_05698 [Cladophialophora immunda]|nr:hypothetical protein CLAIMM_05698 [Cladophialophora immunda]